MRISRSWLVAATMIGTAPVAAAQIAVTATNALPPSVKTLYLTLCPPDDWIGGKPILYGSASSQLSDGTSVFLMVCGDAGSSVPYTAIVMRPDGAANEAVFKWTFHGKALDPTGLSNARFGHQPGSIVSSAHVSATCEPTYVHGWDGAAFQVMGVTRRGCRKDE